LKPAATAIVSQPNCAVVWPERKSAGPAASAFHKNSQMVGGARTGAIPNFLFDF
jgi:hypothetical protein